jgi:diadenosine tetraphosphate (Ap4A) HIT family hydrolase
VALQLPKKEPCPFCETIEGRIDQWSIVERTELTITLLSGRQYEIGQCLVIPIRHAPTLLDLSDREAGAVMVTAKRLSNIMMEAFDPSGILLYQNNGVGSGQEVPHFHLHVVPRRPASDWGIGPPHIARVEREGHPAHLDPSVVTDRKREAVEILRRYLA